MRLPVASSALAFRPHFYQWARQLQILEGRNPAGILRLENIGVFRPSPAMAQNPLNELRRYANREKIVAVFHEDRLPGTVVGVELRLDQADLAAVLLRASERGLST